MLQLGWKAGTEQYEPDELLEYAVAAEAAGFDSIDASDHFHQPLHFDEACALCDRYDCDGCERYTIGATARVARE